MLPWVLDHLSWVAGSGILTALVMYFRRRFFKWGRNEMALGYCREDLETANSRIVVMKEREKNRALDCADICDDYCASLTERTR